jgi:hypothetical protein
MLEEIAIGPVLTTQPGTPTVPPVAAAPVSAPPASSSGNVSPPSDLNPQVGIVVIQYRNTDSNFKFSIPSQQQLDAYAANALKSLGPEESTTV